MGFILHWPPAHTMTTSMVSIHPPVEVREIISKEMKPSVRSGRVEAGTLRARVGVPFKLDIWG